MQTVIPSRTHRPTKDPIFALHSEAEARRRSGARVINATIGTLLHDDGTLAIIPAAQSAVAEVPPEEWAAYAPIAGLALFRRSVIADTFSSQPSLAESAFAVATPGGTGALRHALVTYLEAGQTALTTSSYWGPYQTIGDEHGRKITTFPMFDDQHHFNVRALDSALGDILATQGRALLILNDPCHNPSGYSLRREEWREVVATLLRHAHAPVTLMVDMAYWLFALGDPRAYHAELLPLLGKVGLAFAWSASKSFTHYGLRVGAIVACDPDADSRTAAEAALAYASRGTWSNCVRGGQLAVARLLSEPALRDSCARERADLCALLARRVEAFNHCASKSRLSYPRYDGGFFVTVFSAEPAADAEKLREKGIFVIPQKEGLRVALCSVAERDIPELVDALAGGA